MKAFNWHVVVFVEFNIQKMVIIKITKTQYCTPCVSLLSLQKSRTCLFLHVNYHVKADAFLMFVVSFELLILKTIKGKNEKTNFIIAEKNQNILEKYFNCLK